MSQPGVVPPPPDVTPNFVNPPSTGYKVIITACVTWALATFFLCLRGYVKLRLIHMVKVDDWFIVIGWLFATGLSVLQFPYVYQSGLGRHLWDIPFSKFNPSFLQIVIAYAILYQMAICFIKLSILGFYLRLSPYRMFQAAVYILIVLVISYSIILVFQIIFRCHPIPKAWDITITTGYCLSVNLVSNLNGFFDATTDCIMLFLPIPLIWRLKVPRKQKFLIALILMTSSFVCIISILRLKETFHGYGLGDASFTFVLPAIYGLLDANIGVVCACLPHLKPILVGKLPRLLGEVGVVSSSIVPTRQVDHVESS